MASTLLVNSFRLFSGDPERGSILYPVFLLILSRGFPVEDRLSGLDEVPGVVSSRSLFFRRSLKRADI